MPGDRDLHEAGLLRLDWSKARTLLGWTPRLRLRDTVELTLEWYRRAADERQSRALYKVSCSQIDRYATWSPPDRP